MALFFCLAHKWQRAMIQYKAVGSLVSALELPEPYTNPLIYGQKEAVWLLDVKFNARLWYVHCSCTGDMPLMH